MNTLTRNYLRSKFREYYLQAALETPPDLESREWGFILFDDVGMRRHKSYLGRGELVDYIRAVVPAHLYHSAAYYQRPGAPTMKEKGWQGADLIFDLDADHLRKAPKSYSDMLDLVKKETLKLLNFLLADFGFSEKNISVVFSGGRGYHIHVRDPRVLALGSDERREIVDYLTGRGLDMERFFAREDVTGGSKRKKNYPVYSLRCPPEDAPGWGGRLNRAIRSFVKDLSKLPESEAIEILSSMKGIKANKAKEFYIYLKVLDQIQNNEIDRDDAIETLSSINWIKDPNDFYIRLKILDQMRKGNFDKNEALKEFSSIKGIGNAKILAFRAFLAHLEEVRNDAFDKDDALKALSSIPIWDDISVFEQISKGNLDGFKGISRNWNILGKYLADESVQIAHLSKFIQEKGETDEPVTADIRRLIRCPTSLHGGSGFRVTPLTIRSLEEFEPLWDAVVFGDEPVVIDVVKPFKTEIQGESYDLLEGRTELPACGAIFLMARGAAELGKALDG